MAWSMPYNPGGYRAKGSINEKGQFGKQMSFKADNIFAALSWKSKITSRLEKFPRVCKYLIFAEWISVHLHPEFSIFIVYLGYLGLKSSNYQSNKCIMFNIIYDLTISHRKLFNFIYSIDTSNYSLGTLLKTKYYILRTINAHSKLIMKLIFWENMIVSSNTH